MSRKNLLADSLGAWRRAAALVVGALLLVGNSGVVRAAPDFVSDIQPIFAAKCYRCHGPDKQQSGLRLDSREMAFRGGDWGEPAIVPGDSAGSLLVQLTTSDEDVRMPPKGEPVSPEEIALLKEWIDAGADWPDEANAMIDAGASRGELQVTEADRDHWAFRPLAIGAPPAAAGVNIVDHYLGSTGGEASRETLIRRLYFDLWGLPPVPVAIDAFVADSATDAYERLVDRLLDDANFGERWARHWLDVARYADSDGYEADKDRPHAWPYRDWVIRAIASDLPFDVFVQWQVAGDELAPHNPDAVAATGFLAAGPCQTTTPADTEENKLKIRYDELDDMTSTVGAAFLGLAVGCGRCHDHKFDPIPTRDYYRLAATFASAQRQTASLSKPRREFDAWKAARRAAWREATLDELQLTDEEKFWLRQPEHFFIPIQMELFKKYGKQLTVSDDALRAGLASEEQALWTQFERAVAEADEDAAKERQALVVLDEGSEPAPAYLLSRGSVTSRVEEVSFGFLQVVSRGKSPGDYLPPRDSDARSALLGADGWIDPPTTHQRAALAAWLVDVDHGAGPLVARVAINRLWQHHFGEGLTPTPNDVGFQGADPVHPDLLEALAAELVAGGWRMKPLHKLILMSKYYRAPSAVDQASKDAPAGDGAASLAPRRPMRLEAEALRDAMLSVSGRLNDERYGPPFRPFIPSEAIATRSTDAYPADIEDGPPVWRRSVYAFNKRSVREPWAEVFDAPDASASCGRRNRTTVPTQALTLLNNRFVRDCAVDFARRVAGDAGDGASAQIERAFRLALGRRPSAVESKQAERFLHETDSPEPAARLADICHLLLTLNEFAYVD